MSSNLVQSIFVYIVFTLTVTVNLISLYLLWKRRDKQPLKSRAPLWLGISLIVAQVQMGTNLWSMLGMVECHFLRVSQFLSYSGYIMCLIVRCWKLHFVFNINKSKVDKTNYKSWFQRKKFYVTERFLVPTVIGFSILLCLIGFIFVSSDSQNTWHPVFGGEKGDTLCNPPWIPDMATNAIIFAACVITLIVFSCLLHNVDDGFSISKELRLSIAIILSSWGLVFALMFGGVKPFEETGPVSPSWIIILSQILSSTAAVYYPLFLSYTNKWLDTHEALPVSVSIGELKDMAYFLNSPSGIEPFVRFLHSEFSAELLFLWRDIEEFAKEQEATDRKIKAKTIYEEYLDPEGNKFMQESESFRAAVKVSLEDPEVPATMLNALREEVEKRLRNKFGRFLESTCYRQYVTGITMKESLMELGWQS